MTWLYRIAVAAIFTLAKLAKPVVGGLVSTLTASRKAGAGDDLDRDISPPWIFGITIACLIIAGALAWMLFFGSLVKRIAWLMMRSMASRRPKPSAVGVWFTVL